SRVTDRGVDLEDLHHLLAPLLLSDAQTGDTRFGQHLGEPGLADDDAVLGLEVVAERDLAFMVTALAPQIDDERLLPVRRGPLLLETGYAILAVAPDPAANVV